MLQPDRATSFDKVGHGYRQYRTTDPFIFGMIEEALGDSITVLNCGAGASSYEAPHRKIIGVEPSEVMIKQRPRGAAPCMYGPADVILPFLDGTMDAATAFFTSSLWGDKRRGFTEMRRIARGPVVILTIVPDLADEPWLTRDYFPQVGLRVWKMFPSKSSGLYEECFGNCEYRDVPLRADCKDGFVYCYWSRPEMYLDSAARAAVHWLAEWDPDPEALKPGLQRLEKELADGTWDAKYGHLRALESFDVGVRLVISHQGS